MMEGGWFLKTEPGSAGFIETLRALYLDSAGVLINDDGVGVGLSSGGMDIEKTELDRRTLSVKLAGGKKRLIGKSADGLAVENQRGQCRGKG